MKLKKFIGVILAAMLSFALFCSACSTGGEEDPDNDNTVEGEVYTVTLHANGGSNSAYDIEGDIFTVKYRGGNSLSLPKLTKSGSVFAGWYDISDVKWEKISETDTGDKEFWAHWDSNTVAPQTYTVTLHLNEGSFPAGVSNLTQYTAGTEVTLPIPQKTNSTFGGWYANQACTGTAVQKILSTDTGNKEFWAKWNTTSVTPQTYTVTLHLNEGSFPAGVSNLTQYTAGTEVTLPIPQKTNSTFGGWYANQACTGTAVQKILSTDTGNKEFWAKWETQTPTPGTLSITVNGYEEGASVTFAAVGGTYKVSYKPADGVSQYTQIDEELIRTTGSQVRADIVGLKAGDYTVKVEAGGKTVEKPVTVTAYDRTGYAHFNFTGVGAYNDDGTLKDNAVVVYVTDENKNTVTVPGLGSGKSGIVDVLNYSKNMDDKPLVVRIIGSVNAATWKEINYDKGGNYNDGNDYDQNNKLPSDKVVGKNRDQLPQKSMTQEELIKGGYNELDTSKYTELKGLSSKINYSSSEFDSAWNNCSIDSAQNVTVEGIGADARLFQWGFTWKNSNSIEVRNLTFEDYTEDACSFEGSSDQTDASNFSSKNLWIHHNTFLEGKNYWDVCPEQDKHEGDGATDFKKNSYITISYNHYYKNHKTGLIGGGDTQKTACVTFHHNWYEICNSRLPLARQANMHMYNNYYYGSTGTNMSIRAGGYAFIEYCYFDNANNPITTQKVDNKKGVAKVYQCIFDKKKVDSQYTEEGTKDDLKNTVIIVTDRTKTVGNDNIYNPNFDTDSAYFYYDATAKKTKVQSGFEMLTAEEVKEKVPDLSGVHK